MYAEDRQGNGGVFMYEEAAGILHELAWNMELHDMRGNRRKALELKRKLEGARVMAIACGIPASVMQEAICSGVQYGIRLAEKTIL